LSSPRISRKRVSTWWKKLPPKDDDKHCYRESYQQLKQIFQPPVRYTVQVSGLKNLETPSATQRDCTAATNFQMQTHMFTSQSLPILTACLSTETEFQEFMMFLLSREIRESDVRDPDHGVGIHITLSSYKATGPPCLRTIAHSMVILLLDQPIDACNLCRWLTLAFRADLW
jgi:hypothetical protein